MDEHRPGIDKTTVEGDDENGYGWVCTCGDCADDYEDAEDAAASAESHEHHGIG